MDVVPGNGVDRRRLVGLRLYAHRAELGVEGNAVMMGFDADGSYNSLFGPAVPVLVGVVLALAGLSVALTRAPALATSIAGGSAVIALSSLAMAGLTATSGLDPGGDIGGSGIRAWAVGSAVGAIALGVVAVVDRPRAPSSAFTRRLVDWAPLPAVMLAGVFGELLYAAEERHPFAIGPVLVTATLTAAFPAAGTVAALLAIAPPGRPLLITVVDTAAFVLGVVLFALWTLMAVS